MIEGELFWIYGIYFKKKPNFIATFSNIKCQASRKSTFIEWNVNVQGKLGKNNKYEPVHKTIRVK